MTYSFVFLVMVLYFGFFSSGSSDLQDELGDPELLEELAQDGNLGSEEDGDIDFDADFFDDEY